MKRPLPIAIAAVLVVLALTAALTAVLASGSESSGRGGTVAGSPTAAGSARASLLGTTQRSDGRRQVTYHGHPLYRYVGDTQPGQTTGQGSRAYGARWFVVSPAGEKVELSGGGQSSRSPYGGQ